MSDHKVRVNQYKKDPFRPQPRLRERSKSRVHHPISQARDGDNFCIRESRCKNAGRCDECVPLFRLWEEKSNASRKEADRE